MPISFNTYKTTTAQKLYNRKLIDKNAFNYIIESKTKYGLSNRVTDCFEDLSKKKSKMAVEISERGSVKQEELPLIKFLQTKMENLTVQFTKILSQKDTNPEVLEIKNKIKKEFGIKSLYLDNNKNFAKKLTKALKILKDNDMIIPDEIIVNSILALSMGIANPQKRIIILNSTLKPDYMMSTESPLLSRIRILSGSPDASG